MSFDAQLGKAHVDIEAPLGPLERDLRKAKRKVENTIGDISRKLTGIGTSLSIGLTLPLAGLGAATIKAASDVEEMRAKFDTVFGDMSDDVHQFAKTQADALNRSKFDLEEYLAALQDTFVPMGFARDEAAELSKTLTVLGIDVASFQNKAEPDVIRDFQAALTGSAETVKKYGIIITEAAINAELMRQGIAGGTKEATEQQKLLAKLNIILQGTKDAQGDAARTSGSFANQMKGLKAAVKDIAVIFGEDFLPTATKGVGKLRSWADRLKELNPEQRRTVEGLALLLAALGPVFLLAGQVGLSVTALTKAYKFVVPAIAAFGTGLAAVTVGPVAAAVAIAAALAAAWWAFRDDIKMIVKFVYNDFKEYLVDKFAPLIDKIRGFTDTIKGYWTDLTGFFGATDPLKTVGEQTESAAEKVKTVSAETANVVEDVWFRVLDSLKFSADELAKKLGFEGIKLPEFGIPGGKEEPEEGPPGAVPPPTETDIPDDPEALARRRAEMLQIEQEFLFDRRQAWLQATDQNIKAIEERRDAEIEALKEMELSEKGAAEARRLIWETAAQDIIDIEKQKNLTITNSLEELNEGFKGAFEGQLDTFIEDLTRGELSFKNFVNAIISEVNRLTARQLSKEISQALFGGGQGAGGGSGLGTLLGLAGTALGALGGGGLASTAGGYGSTVVSGAELTAYGAPLRQRGGPVVPGQAYLVGESGAELFRSASAGEIIPNDQIGSGRPVVVNMTINTPDANSFRASQSQIAAETSVALRRADARGN